MKRRRFLATGLAAIAAPLSNTPAQAETRSRWRPDGAGRLARIGVLTPYSDPVPESEMSAMAPDGVSIHASRVPPYRSPAAFAEPPGIDTAAELLAELAPRAIVVAYTGSSYALGAHAEGPTRMRLEERVRMTPVVLTATAATEALRVLGARRVAVIHPPWYSEETNARGGEYFRGHGFDVALCARLTPARSATEVEPAEVYEWVRANTPSQADAVFIGGNGFRSIGAIHALESALYRPVLTANQVSFWAALRAAKVKVTIAEYGRIFANG